MLPDGTAVTERGPPQQQDCGAEQPLAPPTAMRDRGCAHSTELDSEEKRKMKLPDLSLPVPKPGGAAVPCPCTSGLEGLLQGRRGGSRVLEQGWPHTLAPAAEAPFMCLCTSKALNLRFFYYFGTRPKLY